MSETQPPQRPQAISALCQTSHGAFVVEVSQLSSDGCTATAPTAWEEEFDFLRLTLGGSVEVNGRVLHRHGREAEIRFFGQIHPCVIESWQRRAA
jgi:hypothetical protein